MRVYIYGRGYGLSFVKKCLLDDVTVGAYIDNFSRDTVDAGGIPIIKQESVDDDFDYIVISIIKFQDIKNGLIKLGISSEKIISFFCPSDAENDSYYSVLDSYKWKTELELKYHNDVVIPAMNNQYYEGNADLLLSSHLIPHIVSADKTVSLIVDEKKSLARFGDGEFEMMLNRARPRFQDVDVQLGKRLEEVIKDDSESLLVAIANNYGDLSAYTDEAANGIRAYLTPTVRSDHMNYLDLHRDYYDAYLSRPYIMYKDKDPKTMRSKFDHIKEIWDKKKILIIEGYHTRFGVGNDLITNALDAKRILAPDKNAFSVYEDIFEKAKKYGRDRLTLITLGPTATVLSYDLSKMGYWAVDIGQVDTEYEWFLRNAKERCNIPYKTVSEYADKNIIPDIDEPFKSDYEKQVVEIIKEKCVN